MLFFPDKSRDIQEVHQRKLTEKKFHRSMEVRVQPNENHHHNIDNMGDKKN